MNNLITASCCCGEDEADCWYGGEAEIGTPTYSLACNFTGFATGLPTTEAWCLSQGHSPCDLDIYSAGIPIPCQDLSGAELPPAAVSNTCGSNGNRNGMVANCECETVRTFTITQQGCTPLQYCDINESNGLARGGSDCIQYMDITGAINPDRPYRDITVAGVRERNRTSTTEMYYVGPINTISSNYGYSFTGQPCCENIATCGTCAQGCWTFDGCLSNYRCHPGHGTPVQQQYHVADCPDYYSGYPNPNQNMTQVGGLIFRPDDMPCNFANVSHSLGVETLTEQSQIFNPDGSIPADALWKDCIRLNRTNQVMLSELTGTPNELMWDVGGFQSGAQGDSLTRNWRPCNNPAAVGLDALDAWNNVEPFGTLPSSCHTACAFGIFTIRKKVSLPYFQLYGRGSASAFMGKVNNWLSDKGFNGYTFVDNGGTELSEIYIGGTTVTNSSNHSAYDKYWKGVDTAGQQADGAMNGCQRKVNPETGKEDPLESRIRCQKEIYMWRTLQQEEIPVSSSVDLGTVTRIVEMGTTTAAQWIAMGWVPYGSALVPAFGTYFVRNSTGAGTGRVQSSNYIQFQCRPIYFVFGLGTYTAHCTCRTFAASYTSYLSPNAGYCTNCSIAATEDCCYPGGCFQTITSPYSNYGASYSFISHMTFGGYSQCAYPPPCTCGDSTTSWGIVWKTPYAALRGNGFDFGKLNTSIVVGDPSPQGQMIAGNLGCPATMGICDNPCVTGFNCNYV